jgi:hypothetical protein
VQQLPSRPCAARPHNSQQVPYQLVTGQHSQTDAEPPHPALAALVSRVLCLLVQPRMQKLCCGPLQAQRATQFQHNMMLLVATNKAQVASRSSRIRGESTAPKQHQQTSSNQKASYFLSCCCWSATAPIIVPHDPLQTRMQVSALDHSMASCLPPAPTNMSQCTDGATQSKFQWRVTQRTGVVHCCEVDKCQQVQRQYSCQNDSMYGC